MKTMNIIATLALLLGLTHPAQADSAGYFRVWQGFKKADLTQQDFQQQLPRFMRDTVDLYEGRGLNNYLVVMPPKNKPDYIPDEFALVALSDEASYRRIRNTQEGQNYGDRHWDVFDRSNSFSSRNFVDHSTAQPHHFRSNSTYDMIGNPIDWSSGYTVVYLGTRQDHLSPNQFLSRLQDHAELVTTTLTPHGLRGYIVLANENYELAYINWPSKKAHDQAFAKTETHVVFKDAATMLDTLMYEEFRPFVAGSPIRSGQAYSTLHEGQRVDKKAAIVLTSHEKLGTSGDKTGYYLPELTHPFYAMTEKGIHVDVVSILGGQAPMDENSRDLSDPLNQEFLERHLELIDNTLTLKDLNPDEYTAVMYAGGHGTMWDFRNNSAIQHFTSSIFEAGGVVAAVCHGPAALLDVTLSDGTPLISDRRVTGFTNSEERAVGLDTEMPYLLETELALRGAEFIGLSDWAEHVVVDGRLVTGQNPASAHKVGTAISELLN